MQNINQRIKDHLINTIDQHDICENLRLFAILGDIPEDILTSMTAFLGKEVLNKYNNKMRLSEGFDINKINDPASKEYISIMNCFQVKITEAIINSLAELKQYKHGNYELILKKLDDL